MYFVVILLLLSSTSPITGHARIKHPRPLAAPPDTPDGWYYNRPFYADGSDFPCKGLHKKAGVNMAPTETWQADGEARFEILGHMSNMSNETGQLAAHSGGSCQASLSFDYGETWKVLHTYQGGCPRDVNFLSNFAGENQTFTFHVPKETRAGKALFSWSWIAVTGSRNEYYQNCASVMIEGSGNSTLDHLPDMFVGDMTIPGHIGVDECRSAQHHAIEYPNPGQAITITKVWNIPFKKPTPGNCYSKASKTNFTTPTSSVSTYSTVAPSSQISTDAPASNYSLPMTLKMDLQGTMYSCNCSCMKQP